MAAVRARSRASRRRVAAMYHVPSPQAIDRKYYCPSNHAHALRPCFVTDAAHGTSSGRTINSSRPRHHHQALPPGGRELDHRRTHAHCDTTTNVHCAKRHSQQASAYTVTVGTLITTCRRCDYITTTACTALELAASYTDCCMRGCMTVTLPAPSGGDVAAGRVW